MEIIDGLEDCCIVIFDLYHYVFPGPCYTVISRCFLTIQRRLLHQLDLGLNPISAIW